MGGYVNSTTYDDQIDYITIATTGNSSDFGDLTTESNNSGGVSNATRGVALGGRGASPFPILNTMQYVTIATLGNALDFGDLTVARMTRSSGCASPTRGCALGGYTPGKSDVIDYIQISTLGNAVDFGNMIAAIAANGCCSNGHGGLSG